MIYLLRDLRNPKTGEEMPAGQFYESSNFDPLVLEALIAENYAQVIDKKEEVVDAPKKKAGRPKKSYETREMTAR